MTPTQREAAYEWGRWFVVAALSVGVAWATLGAKVDNKLDASRFVTDSINRRTRDTLFLERFDRIERQNMAILRALCSDRPGGCQ